MNIQQLQYIIAVDKHRHFAKAADACFVTQPTLSMMIKKLEEEIDAQIFDRTKHPVIPTELGSKLIEQAKKILLEADRFSQLAHSMKNTLSGELKMGIIPTVSPYLTPLFVKSFLSQYPEVHLEINEFTTADILEKLDNGDLDLGILVPLDNDDQWHIHELYTEPFVVYTPIKFQKEYLLAEDLKAEDLLLLEEGHCFRTQIMKFCELRKNSSSKVQYNSGSLETLRNLADREMGITILPQLATLNFSSEQLKKVHQFVAPQPVRQVAIITKRYFIKEALVNAVKSEILKNIPKAILNYEGEIIPFLGN